ncbi:MAG: isoprenyl transferase [Gymnodinialimonas sp.]
MRVFGHRKGLKTLQKVSRAARNRGIEVLTLYAFSSENWRRAEAEVSELMNLLRTYLKSETAQLHKENVQLRVIGERQRFAPDIIELIEQAEEITANNTGAVLCVALSYGSRAEITGAVRDLAQQVADGKLSPDQIDEQTVENALWTSGLPAPDLVIRTSGEQRLSNFLMWQAAYAELYFSPVMWPDFDEAELDAALDCFAERDRRYGREQSKA